MSGDQVNRSAVFLSSSWLQTPNELAFVTRSLAGAASRLGKVSVLTPMPAGTSEADGAFDLVGIGTTVAGGAWPETAPARWPIPLEASLRWIVDEPDDAVLAFMDTFSRGSETLSVAAAHEGAAGHVSQLELVTSRGSDCLGLHVPINPLAGKHRHMGLGFTGYILVLTDRSATPPVEPPTAAVGWLTSRFYDHYVVVVEGGTAAVWKGRALRGVVAVDTRTDLWRLLAHAQLTVDLGPGDIIARESIESLRFGTPVVVPAASVAAAHAHAGGGIAFADMRGLLEGVEQLLHDSDRESFSRVGTRYANGLYGDASTFVRRLGAVLWPGA